MGVCDDGAIYTVNVVGGSPSNTPSPSAGCNKAISTDSTTFTFTADERITRIFAITDDAYKWFYIQITLNSGRSLYRDTRLSHPSFPIAGPS